MEVSWCSMAAWTLFTAVWIPDRQLQGGLRFCDTDNCRGTGRVRLELLGEDERCSWVVLVKPTGVGITHSYGLLVSGLSNSTLRSVSGC